MSDFQEEQLVFDLDQFSDPTVLRSTCMVCALPSSVRRKVERQLIMERERPVKDIAAEHSLTETDISDHIDNCVLDRDTLIPMGHFIRSWVEETQSFISHFSRFKTALMDSNEIDADGVTAYSTAMDKLRITIRDFARIQDPDYIADRIKTHVLNPMIIQFYRILAEEMGYLIRESNRFVPERQRTEFRDMVKGLNKRIGTKQKEGMNNILVSLAEQTGATPKNLGQS